MGWHGEVSWQGWKHATTLCLVWQCVFNEPYNVFQIMLESLILLK